MFAFKDMCLRIAAVSVLRIKGTAHIRRTHEMLTYLVSAWEKIVGSGELGGGEGGEETEHNFPK